MSGAASRLAPHALLQDRAVAAYLGLAIGDALGATVEFMSTREIESEYGVHERMVGGGWLKLKPGQVTDDTTMALALGESILNSGGIDARSIAEAFDAWMRAKPVDIGNTVRRGLLAFRSTGVPAVPLSEHDAGNGAAMRVLPVALATLGQSEQGVREACRIQAHVTHHHPLSDAATECLALMVQAAVQGADLAQLLHRYAYPLAGEHPAFVFRTKQRRSNPSGYIVETVQAVFQALFDSDSFRGCLVDAVNRGGDADTTGAIAGMLAGALYGTAAIPGAWLKALDPAIRLACARQALALVAMSGMAEPAPAKV
ncbi:MAG: ADP-ribosyl-[dinitrogen reductase] hydrolase [Betaproteobacteria bacterium]|nr:ADP-ribosyl-[dinitrogen reductase] hydrolase [Betaproteobacteria bacterium]